MLSVLWDHRDITYFKFLNHNQVFNADLKPPQLKRVDENSQRKCPALVRKGNGVFLLNNARSQTAKLTQERTSDLGFCVSPHPPYALNDEYFFFQKIQ